MLRRKMSTRLVSDLMFFFCSQYVDEWSWPVGKPKPTDRIHTGYCQQLGRTHDDASCEVQSMNIPESQTAHSTTSLLLRAVIILFVGLVTRYMHSSTPQSDHPWVF